MSFNAGFAGKFFKTMREISISVKGTVGLFLKESGIIENLFRRLIITVHRIFPSVHHKSLFIIKRFNYICNDLDNWSAT